MFEGRQTEEIKKYDKFIINGTYISMVKIHNSNIYEQYVRQSVYFFGKLFACVKIIRYLSK